MDCFLALWQHLKPAGDAAWVTIEIGLVGAIIAGLQLQYAQRRDKKLDERNSWTELHKAMLDLRFRLVVLDTMGQYGVTGPDAMLAAGESMHRLKGQLDRTPDSELQKNVTALLNNYPTPAQYRAQPFIKQFDELAHEVACKTR